ncbi:MAG: hypothetical protein HOV82_16785 [Streptomyces sp.]|nr:hypothetical protein [Streptomyces sp.]NUP36169.1 hypothetical protein [Streptomyces sp.]NUS75516.1 hypothetical protein [Streptomyces sp.]
MIGDAIDTAITLGWALTGWIITLAVIASILTLAAIATGAWGARALWRAATGPSWARGGLRARIYAARRLRRSSGRTRPHWAHRQPLDIEEAA